MGNLYFFSLCLLLFSSFGVGLCYSNQSARIFAYMGVLAYIVGIALGVYYE